jgi:hypothetical protein
MHRLDQRAFERWLHEHFSSDERTAIPLFAHSGLVVQMVENRVPKRSHRMEQLYAELMSEAKNQADACGIVYCMYWIRSNWIVPLYLGKAERYGKDGLISANLTNRSFFGRWGYSKDYHFGNLGIGLQGGRKYRHWVERLFESPAQLRLRSETFFGATLCSHAHRCCCGAYANAAAIEDCLIRHAREFFRDDNLNRKGGGSRCRCPIPALD